jgi:hypothetical protein
VTSYYVSYGDFATCNLASFDVTSGNYVTYEDVASYDEVSFVVASSNLASFDVTRGNHVTWDVDICYRVSFYVASFDVTSIRKDCFQVKSNLLTVDNLVFHY